MFRPTSVLVLILAIALSASACDSDEPVAPSEPEPVEVSETFGGRLTGAATHTFGVQRPGTVVATVGTLVPDSAGVISVSLGTWNGQSCAILIAMDAATSGTSVVGNATTVGDFCVRVLDVGRLTQPTDYEITVRHF
jgi:hypothetical protein